MRTLPTSMPCLPSFPLRNFLRNVQRNVQCKIQRNVQRNVQRNLQRNFQPRGLHALLPGGQRLEQSSRGQRLFGWSVILRVTAAGMAALLLPGANAAFGQAAAQATGKAAAGQAAAPFVVQIPVTLRDKKGRLLTSYSAADLTLADNGHPQTIASFAHPANEPLRIGLLIDTTSGQQAALDSERAACGHFVDEMLTRPNTKIFLLHFDHEVELLQDFTTSAQKLHTELNEMTTAGAAPAQQTAGGQVGTVGRTAPVHNGAEVYDAVYLAARELMAPEHGRKVMVIFTNGYDRDSKEGLNEAIDAAQRAQVSVFTVYVKSQGAANRQQGARPGLGGPGMGGPGRFPGGGYPGGGYPGGGYPGGGYPGGGYPGAGSPGNAPGGSRPGAQAGYGDGKKTLEQIALRSGGRYFEDIRGSEYGDVLRQISDELQAQFALRYAPNDLQDDSFSDGFHKISLRARDKSMFVITTEGYFEPGKDAGAHAAGK